MGLWHSLTALAFISSIVYCQSPATSSKRGLVYVPSEKHPQDDANWDSPTSDLTWYYNYASKPSPAFANFPKLQFVPMLWGTGNSSTFLTDVQSQIKAGANITYVLGFNEPDGDSSTYVFSERFLPLRDGNVIARHASKPRASLKPRDLFFELNLLLYEEILTLKSLLAGAVISQQRRQHRFGCSRSSLWPSKESSLEPPHVQGLRLAFNGRRASLQLALTVP